MNDDPPPNAIDRGGGAQLSADEAEGGPLLTSSHALPSIAQPLPPACDRNHQNDDTLAPDVIAGHRALNPERAIFPGEWYELLALQAAHGEARMLIWQARAARRTEGQPSTVHPGYYRACAARAAVESYRPRQQECPTPECVPALASPIPSPAPRPLLDPACDALLRAMGIRERELLAQVPLALIQQWARVIDHPGLAARFDDVRAFAHRQLRLGQPPPSLGELERWAERARSRAAAAPLPALTNDQIAAIEARQEAIESRAAAITPDDLADEERLALLADLERGMPDTEALDQLAERRTAISAPPQTPEQICRAILEDLHQPLHRRLHPLLAGITLQPADDELRIVCGHVGDMDTVEAEIAPHIRVALRSYIWQPTVQVIAAVPPPIAPPSEPQPPVWIAPERWASLPGLLRAMLLGSTVEDGTLRCVSPGLTKQVRARYGEVVMMLLAERTEEAGDATR